MEEVLQQVVDAEQACAREIDRARAEATQQLSDTRMRLETRARELEQQVRQAQQRRLDDALRVARDESQASLAQLADEFSRVTSSSALSALVQGQIVDILLDG